MKKRFKFLSLGLVVFFVLSCVVACAGGGQTHETPKPVLPTSSPKPVPPSVQPTDAGTANPANSQNPVNPSGEPSGSGAPQSANPTGDPNFKQGTIINPDEAPDTVKAVEKEFRGYKIKAITCEYYEGREAYKVTLQGEGELAKTVYVLMNGDIVIPKMT